MSCWQKLKPDLSLSNEINHSQQYFNKYFNKYVKQHWWLHLDDKNVLAKAWKVKPELFQADFPKHFWWLC